MHVNVQHRFNAELGLAAPYFRLKRSYRDVSGKVHSLIMLNVGFEPEMNYKMMKRIADVLSERFAHPNQNYLFESPMDLLSPFEQQKASEYWQRMVDLGTIDRFNSREEASRKEAERYVDLDTVKHTDVRNLKAEWLCKQTIDRLEIEQFLRKEGWSELQIQSVLSELIVRTVYCSSEHMTYKLMQENSAACELYSRDPNWTPGFNSLYELPDKLYEIKEKLEDHLCRTTDHLFQLDNRIMLFDLTNFYFEGRKANSQKARFGRSKEKRSDCRLLVLALCINKEGFIRYSAVLEGNASDPQSLPDMIQKLSQKQASVSSKNTLVVMDAGVATEENLNLIKAKGYNYLCVSRVKLKNYELDSSCEAVTVKDYQKNDITLRRVQRDEDGDHFLEITSPTKAMTEASMNRLFKQRFEEEMAKVNAGIAKKGGTKKYEKVLIRCGRAIQRYPSIARHYDMSYVRNETKPEEMLRVEYKIKDLTELEANSGVYFLRTNVLSFDEKTTWDYYNLIREIETTNRQLKTDLNLRPIFHQKDSRSEAHLFFGLLSYWVVNTIRHELKGHEIKCYWPEIVRRMSTQKIVTTEAINALGEKVQFRQCSAPSLSAKEIYEALKLKSAPFKKIKICRTQPPPNDPPKPFDHGNLIL